MSLSVSQVGFLCAVAVCAAVVVAASFQRDRFLGWIVLSALVLYIIGGVAFGMYLREARGRDYFSPDEIGYLEEAQRIVESWQGGRPHAPGVEGGYAYWNAAVITAWGPSLVPLRLANALIGGLTVLLAYELACSFFGGVSSARLAAVAVALWPSLVVWSLGNLKERSISLVVLVVSLLCVRLIERWSVSLLLGLAAALVTLGQLRHYYGAVLGWFCVIGFLLFARSHGRQRLVQSLAVVSLIGFALWTFTGAFMATHMRHEQVRRYVVAEAAPPSGDHALALEELARLGSPATTDAMSGSRGGGSAVLRRDTDFSLQGEHAGHAEAARWSSTRDAAHALGYVLFGRFDERAGAGRVLARVLYPEWLLTFLVVPLAVAGTLSAMWRGVSGAWVAAAFIATLIGVLTWAHGDEWTTYRLRIIYLPLLLVFAAGGLAPLMRGWRIRSLAAAPRL